MSEREQGARGWNCTECAILNRGPQTRCKWCGSAARALEPVEGSEARPLWSLGLSTRSFNAVCRGWARAEGFTVDLARRWMTLGDLAALSPGRLLTFRHFGLGCLDEVREVLATEGLQLAGDQAAAPFAGSIAGPIAGSIAEQR